MRQRTPMRTDICLKFGAASELEVRFHATKTGLSHFPTHLPTPATVSVLFIFYLLLLFFNWPVPLLQLCFSCASLIYMWRLFCHYLVIIFASWLWNFLGVFTFTFVSYVFNCVHVCQFYQVFSNQLQFRKKHIDGKWIVPASTQRWATSIQRSFNVKTRYFNSVSLTTLKQRRLNVDSKSVRWINVESRYFVCLTTLKQRRFNIDSTSRVESTLNQRCCNVVCMLVW